jgi:hypothetical protein
MGNSVTWHNKKEVANSTSSCVQQMGASWHLAKLHLNPDAPSKITKIFLITWRSVACG